MTQLATVHALDPDNELSVTLRVGAVIVTCFASNPPGQLAVGKVYPVEFTVLDCGDVSVEEADQDAAPSLVRVGPGYHYRATGRIVGDSVNVGIVIEPPWPYADYAYLDGKMVTFEIDRLDVSFVEPTD